MFRSRYDEKSKDASSLATVKGAALRVLAAPPLRGGSPKIAPASATLDLATPPLLGCERCKRATHTLKPKMMLFWSTIANDLASRYK